MVKEVSMISRQIDELKNGEDSLVRAVSDDTEESDCKLDLIFEELIVEKDIRERPYYSIQYRENGESHVGYGSYSMSVISDYLKHYFGIRTSSKMEQVDSISRQTVLDEIDDVEDECDETGDIYWYAKLRERIMSLPSADRPKEVRRVGDGCIDTRHG